MKAFNINRFREDLQNGMSLEECLNKHNTNLQDAFYLLHGYDKRSESK